MNRVMRSTGILAILSACCLGGATTLSADEPLRNVIDAALAAEWKTSEVQAAAPAGDAEFLRRVHLDLVGTIPTYEETREFLSDAAPDKREKLVDRLLDDPRFGVYQAKVWDLVLFGRSVSNSRVRERDGFRNWMAKQFNDNVPYDQWAQAILKAEGNTVEDGPATFLLQYAGNDKSTAVAVSRLFMGMQLQCAECHDHPFEDFSQIDFYGMAAFYARLQPVSLGKKDNKDNYMVGERSTGDTLFAGKAIDQKPGTKGEAVAPKYLKGDELDEPELPKDFKAEPRLADGKVPPAPHYSRKNALAEWIANPENIYFTEAIANRIWSQFMGRGVVHPVDNLSDFNPPSHPDLWEVLPKELVARKYDLKWLIREIVGSKTYQLSAAGPVDRAMPRWFEQAKVRPLMAEELGDALAVATRMYKRREAAQDDKAKQAVEGDFGRVRGNLVSYFGEPVNGVGDYQGNMFENLLFNNEVYLHRYLYSTGTNQLLADLVASEASPEEKVEEMFLSVLIRKPTAEETAKYVAYVGQEQDSKKQTALWGDAIWALLASSEFRFNH
ncbi:MAG: DUF1549 domain-containing protein [Planctomycetaceae bacterium]